MLLKITTQIRRGQSTMSNGLRIKSFPTLLTDLDILFSEKESLKRFLDLKELLPIQDISSSPSFKPLQWILIQPSTSSKEK